MDQDQVDVIAKSRERGVNAHGRWYRWALYLVRLAARTRSHGRFRGGMERAADRLGARNWYAFCLPANCYPTSK